MIVLILIFAFIMRMVGISQSLWLDEAIGALVVKGFSYHQIISDFLRSDNHPPLYYLFLKFWTGIFGYSEVSLRLPSILFSLGTIYMVYLIAKKITKNRQVPLVAAFVLATSSFFIYYSQEARMYAMATFLASAVVYVFLRLVERETNFGWIAFAFLLTALMFTDYMPIFLLPVIWLWVLKKKRKDTAWLSKFVMAHLPLVGFGILWMPIFLSQRAGGAWLLRIVPKWRDVAGGANIKEALLVWAKFVFGRISLIDKRMYYFLVSIASVPVVFSLWKAVRHKKLIFFWLWLVVPLILGFLASVFFPAFIYFRYLYIVPAFYLLITFGAFQYKKRIITVFIIGFIVASNFISWLIYVTDKTQQREEWRQATAFVEGRGSKDNVAIFEYPEPFAPYRWYKEGKITAVGVLDSVAVQDVKKVKQLVDAAIAGKNEVYHFEYLRDLADPSRVVEERLREDGFNVANEYGDFNGVGLITRWVRK